MIAGGDRRQPYLLPPGIGLVGDDAGRKSPGIERYGERLGRVEHEIVMTSRVVGAPLPQQAVQIAARAGRAAAQFTCVDPNSHRLGCRPRPRLRRGVSPPVDTFRKRALRFAPTDT